MIDVALLGTGGMMPLPNRALTSLYLRYNGHSILIDCGEGTQTRIRLTPFNFKSIDAVFFTHFHGDHMSGLPGLLLSMGNESRTEPVTIYGPLGISDVVNSLRVIAPELPFEVKFVELDTNTVSHFECVGLKIDSLPLDHNLPCLGYNIKLERSGKFNAQRAKALGIPLQFWNRLQKGESVDGFCPDDVLGAARKGIHLLYATDTRPVDVISEYGENADLLILEGIFGAPEKHSRAEETRHMMMQEAAVLAKKANAKELWLTHFSPAMSEPKEYSEELEKIFRNTVVAQDGIIKVLSFE